MRGPPRNRRSARVEDPNTQCTSESRRLQRVAVSQARISRNLSRGGIASWRSGGARALNRVARAARGMRSGPWTPREELDCLEAFEDHGPAFFKAGVCFTEAKVRCHFDKIQEAVVTRDIWQIKDYVDRFFSTATSPEERRDIFTRKLAAAVEALEADDVWRHQRAQAASEQVDVAASADVAAYLKAAAAVATATDKDAARAERDALEEAAVNAYPDLFPVVEARRPCPNSRAAAPLA